MTINRNHFALGFGNRVGSSGAGSIPGQAERRPQPRRNRSRVAARLMVAGLLSWLCAGCGDDGDGGGESNTPPNILFVIMDDVGIDQLTVFGYGGDDPPSTPNLQTIANGGVSFGNTWAMPACSTSRAVFFTGRFPLRTNVYGALGPRDLANSQVSPFEVTLPTVLKQRGYKSGLFGKFHLGLQGMNPYRHEMTRALGWDYFYGWLDDTGDPSSIDTWAGTQPTSDEKGPYSCGFIPGADQPGGADEGACYDPTGGCKEMVLTEDGIPPGRACRDEGGILDKNERCKSPRPANIVAGFNNLSAHYVSPLYIVDESGPPEAVPPQDIRARTYRGTAPVDAAIDWIQSQPKHTPWMASVSFASAHTPVMQPPQALVSGDAAATSDLICSSDDPDMQDELTLSQRQLTNLMIEAMDTEIARLLVSIGVARRDENGLLTYDPDNSDTMIVILGDNGTLGLAVKPPFDGTRAKGTAYQTGVWVPMVVAGPLVESPNRSVTHMVNIVDLYQLFGEIADINVEGSVPRTIDSMSMLPYLTNPDQDSIRSWNFTQVGPNDQVAPGVNPPCTIGSSCTQIPVTESVCTDNNGTWWAAGSPDPLTKGGVLPAGINFCCQVNQYVNSHPPTDGSPVVYFNLQPLRSVAVRNDEYKVVRNSYNGIPTLGDMPPGDVTQEDLNCDELITNEFYEINETEPLIDREDLDLFKLLPELTPEQKVNYVELTKRLAEILASQPPCIGDGNIDAVVDELDQSDWQDFAELSLGQSSWYDINKDSATNAEDLAIIDENQGTVCGD